MFTVFVFFMSYSSSVLSSIEPTPVVLWHGINDHCCHTLSLGKVKKNIEIELPGVYVLSLMIGKNEKEDKRNGFFMNVNDQVTFACKKIASDPKLKGGYNAVGFSQGSQFIRAVVQRCPNPPIFNLITLGGQHQGIYGLPECWYCDTVKFMFQRLKAARYGFIQNKSTIAHYWHDPTDEERYRKEHNFIAEINNELDKNDQNNKTKRNDEYKENLLRLKNFVLVKFKRDTIIKPADSSWFEFYEPGQAEIITTLKKSRLYIEDRLGLRTLDETGRLHFLLHKFNHLQQTNEWFTQFIIDKYLR